MNSIEFEEIGQVFKVLLSVLFIFALINHSFRASGPAGDGLYGYNGLRLTMGSYVLSSARICPAAIAPACYNVTDALSALFGLHR